MPLVALFPLVLLADPELDHGRVHRERPLLGGVKLGAAGSPGRDVAPTAPDLVLGVFGERVLVPHWLELELELPVRWGPRGALSLPIDLHLKKPFHPAPRVSPYVGFGPSIELFVRPERRWQPGASAVTGCYVWLTQRFGVDLDVSGDVVFEHGRGEFTVLVAFGPVWRGGRAMRRRRGRM